MVSSANLSCYLGQSLGSPLGLPPLKFLIQQTRVLTRRFERVCSGWRSRLVKSDVNKRHGHLLLEAIFR